VPASAVPSWVVTGTKLWNTTALRIVHGATAASATATSTAGGASARHDQRGRASQTATTSGARRIAALARVRIASPASRPASTAQR
jgi:hypothetical protein